MSEMDFLLIEVSKYLPTRAPAGPLQTCILSGLLHLRLLANIAEWPCNHVPVVWSHFWEAGLGVSEGGD